MSTVISVENVSKLYRLGEIGTGSLSHDVNRWWHRARGKEDPYLKIGQSNDRASKGTSDYVYALKDVSFEVKQGEVLGIIGRNGAGKSTLLKILSRVTTPTTGEIKARGRIASLLEVGTGFHPELSGRDNIYLNGAILGMRKHEISRKFDEIVEFSGCERYIDTPVKRYSSGMYVRLAFAVAAHLESEILIVDEVLAVGDAEFQSKCLGKMKDVASHGRTVLFVSHNLSAVERLCPSVILMSKGEIEIAGRSDVVINHYARSGTNSRESATRLKNDADRLGFGRIRIRAFSVNDQEGEECSSTAAGSSPILRFECENSTGSLLSKVSLGYSLSKENGDNLAVQYSDYEASLFDVPAGKSTIEARITALPVSPGSYSIGARILVNGIEEDWPQFPVGNLVVEGGDYAGSAVVPHSGRGSLLLRNEWSVIPR